jgi:hypothetical protein
MIIEDELIARIRAAKAWDKEARLEDFQVKAGENGVVLINLKTRRAQLLYDEDSTLHDLEQLFPGETRKTQPGAKVECGNDKGTPGRFNLRGAGLSFLVFLGR